MPQSRRSFFKTALATIFAGELSSGCASQNKHSLVATPLQMAKRRLRESPVALINCPSYEENIFLSLKTSLKNLDLPNLSGKTVLIKPNMVDFVPEKPLFTHPAVLKAAVELANHLGAHKIVIGDGPAHNRDEEYLLAATGLGAMCRKLGVNFINLNIDELEKIENPQGFSGLLHFYLPKTAVESDAIISLPKLKTHHWATVTASMKNLFGVVPGRKYGWPKNLLHHKGIDECIVDLTSILKPAFSLVDAIVAMEGDGPLNGTAKKAGFLALGTDPAAVDATCIRAMSIEPSHIPYIKLAGQVIGNINAKHVKIYGASLASLTQVFALPPNVSYGNNHDKKQSQAAVEADSS